MTLNNLVPWGRKMVPIRKSDDYMSTPRVLSDFDNPWSELEQLFDRVFNMAPSRSFGAVDRFSPVLDVHETDKEFQINLEVPGMTEKDIDISVSKDALVIIPLSENGIDTDKAEASYKNGVLSIKRPKAPGF